MAELVRAGTVAEIEAAGRKVVSVGGAPVLVLAHEGAFRALDNRCPHMGFPLHQGDVKDGLLDCHWHHARFDVTCGATLDPWADDVDCYSVVVEDGVVFVDPERPTTDARARGKDRILRGLEHNLRLVVAKGVIDVELEDALEAGAWFGGTQHAQGWRSGLTILSAMANVYDALDAQDRSRAMTKALAWIGAECAGSPPRRALPALSGTDRSEAGLRDWFRETVEVRDADGAERVLFTLVLKYGLDAALDAVLAACTDHRYCDVGHTLDFAVKCAELCDGHEYGVVLFPALVPQLVQMQRMEETSTWRRPVDVASLVAAATDRLPDTFGEASLADEAALVQLMLEEDPAATLDRFVELATAGTSPVALADAVTEAGLIRVLQFGKANEVPDWDTVHHTLTYANAVAEGMRRVPSRELFRGVLDGVASVYLDRFLNLPPAPLPQSSGAASRDALLALYDQRASVDEVAAMAMAFDDPAELLATLGHVVLREDAGFHDYQALEIGWRRLERTGRPLALVAAARWLAARYPTMRGQEQTFSIAWRLHRGDAVFSA